MSSQVQLDGRDDASSQRLPPAYHHVDHSLAAQHRFDHLLPVLVGQVHVIDFQQPVIHPAHVEPIETIKTIHVDF